jgi:D-alanyl-D-alanine carboxypeptidase (penicillin-binding protein 5/6)
MFTSVFAYGDVNITSKSALLMDYSTGKIIFSQNENERFAPASLTKIMTLLITMESIDNSRINLEDKVYVSKNAASIKGSTAFLDDGESQTVENLIKAVAVRSANDASVALAEYILGSEEAFVKYMNERASQLGMNNTNFTNASGWPDANLYSTAFDVGIMSRELMKHDKVYKYLSIYMEDLAVGRSKSSIQQMVNTNRL